MKRPLNFLLLLWLPIYSVSQTSQIPHVEYGKIERIEDFQSEFVQSRNVDVWLPEGYDPAAKYAVLYMHDGQMLFDSSITWNGQEWGVDETLQKLMNDGSILPTIVVGVWNGDALRHPEYFPQKPFESLSTETQEYLLNRSFRGPGQKVFSAEVQSDNYLRFLVKELIPFINGSYSTYADKAHTFIAGSSMGGLISMYAICEYPEVFGGAACLSTHWPGIFEVYNNPVPAAFIDYLRQSSPNPEGHRLYFDNGTEGLDAMYGETQRKANEVFAARGFDEASGNFLWREFKGDDHSERTWSARLAIPMSFLLQK